LTIIRFHACLNDLSETHTIVFFNICVSGVKLLLLQWCHSCCCHHHCRCHEKIKCSPIFKHFISYQHETLDTYLSYYGTVVTQRHKENDSESCILELYPLFNLEFLSKVVMKTDKVLALQVVVLMFSGHISHHWHKISPLHNNNIVLKMGTCFCLCFLVWI
jgi:hypothetical protein